MESGIFGVGEIGDRIVGIKFVALDKELCDNARSDINDFLLIVMGVGDGALTSILGRDEDGDFGIFGRIA